MVLKDTRSQTGGLMTMENGGEYVKYIKLKLYTKSLTKSKIHGFNDIMTKVIWNQYFLGKTQRYKIHGP